MKFEFKKRKKQNENVNKFQPKKNKRKFQLEKNNKKMTSQKKEMQINFYFAMITLGRTEIKINFFSQSEM